MQATHTQQPFFTRVMLDRRLIIFVANGLFVIGDELRERVNKILGDTIPNLNAKLHDLNLGVDTALFEPIYERSQRRENINTMAKLLAVNRTAYVVIYALI